jgi:hypothetical protein
MTIADRMATERSNINNGKNGREKERYIYRYIDRERERSCQREGAVTRIGRTRGGANRISPGATLINANHMMATVYEDNLHTYMVA